MKYHVAREPTCASIEDPMPANGQSLGAKETWVVGIGANGLEYTMDFIEI